MGEEIKNSRPEDRSRVARSGASEPPGEKESSSERGDSSGSRISENSFLSRDIQPLLAILIILLSFFMFGKVLFSPAAQEESNIEMMVLGALISIDSAIVSYYFGASRQNVSRRSSHFSKKSSGE